MEKKNYIEIIDQNSAQMIECLQNLVRIDSVQEASEEGMPFGKGVHEAFLYALAMGEKEGYVTKNVDNYGGHIDIGEGDETVGILIHVDVVPEGSGWTYEPFGGEIVDGRMYGRGTADDKGPFVACFYAVKAILESGMELKKKVRIIIGLDEETGWKGMDYYLQREEKPDIGFAPDGDFPVIRGEKGILIFEMKKPLGTKTNAEVDFAKDKDAVQAIELLELKGGLAANSVAEVSKAVLAGADYTQVQSNIDKLVAEHSYDIKTRIEEGKLILETKGVSSHGAMPEKGLNAISIMMACFEGVQWADVHVSQFVEMYNKHIGFDVHGNYIGCGFEDEESGKLAFNVGKVELGEGELVLTINIRYPFCTSETEVMKAVRDTGAHYGMSTDDIRAQAPLYFSEDDEYIQLLMGIYQKYTGDLETKPSIIGGGTYARAMDNMVAFGMLFPGEVDSMHQKDESISIENFIKATKIYAEVIAELAK